VKSELYTFVSEIWLYVSVALGLAVGSFLNVVIGRLPVMMRSMWDKEVAEYCNESIAGPYLPYNLLTPVSHCPKCKTSILPFHNIPVLSYLFLKGKCAECALPISIRYPLVEVLTGVLFGLTAWKFHGVELSLCYMGLVAAFISLAFIDLDTYLLPDDITLPLMWAGFIFQMVFHTVPLEDALLGAIVGYLSLWCVYEVFKLITGKEGMGYGDFKLLAAMGAWFGWESLPSIVLVASALGSIVGLISLKLAGRNKDHPIPFGPSLVAGGLVWMFGFPAIGWLTQLLHL